uniref:Cell division protein n=1 Tax=Neochloris aquatica TaxID=3099 RepID=A0A140H9H8_9CHLO|nr:cell division protein [Neochloris aquatica]AMO00827.1 cell division protein [Neochloris aquatica]
MQKISRKKFFKKYSFLEFTITQFCMNSSCKVKQKKEKLNCDKKLKTNFSLHLLNSKNLLTSFQTSPLLGENAKAIPSVFKSVSYVWVPSQHCAKHNAGLQIIFADKVFQKFFPLGKTFEKLLKTQVQSTLKRNTLKGYRNNMTNEIEYKLLENLKIKNFFPEKKIFMQYWIFPLVGFVTYTWNSKIHFPFLFSEQNLSLQKKFQNSQDFKVLPESFQKTLLKKVNNQLVMFSSSDVNLQGKYTEKLNSLNKSFHFYFSSNQYESVRANLKTEKTFEDFYLKNYADQIHYLNKIYINFLQNKIFHGLDYLNFYNQPKYFYWFNNQNFLKQFQLKILNNKLKFQDSLIKENCPIKILPIFLKMDYKNFNKNYKNCDWQNPIDSYEKGKNYLENNSKMATFLSRSNFSFLVSLKKKNKFFNEYFSKSLVLEKGQKFLISKYFLSDRFNHKSNSVFLNKNTNLPSVPKSLWKYKDLPKPCRPKNTKNNIFVTDFVNFELLNKKLNLDLNLIFLLKYQPTQSEKFIYKKSILNFLLNGQPAFLNLMNLKNFNKNLARTLAHDIPIETTIYTKNKKLIFYCRKIKNLKKNFLNLNQFKRKLKMLQYKFYLNNSFMIHGSAEVFDNLRFPKFFFKGCFAPVFVFLQKSLCKHKDFRKHKKHFRTNRFQKCFSLEKVVLKNSYKHRQPGRLQTNLWLSLDNYNSKKILLGKFILKSPKMNFNPVFTSGQYFLKDYSKTNLFLNNYTDKNLPNGLKSKNYKTSQLIKQKASNLKFKSSKFEKKNLPKFSKIFVNFLKTLTNELLSVYKKSYFRINSIFINSTKTKDLNYKFKNKIKLISARKIIRKNLLKKKLDLQVQISDYSLESSVFKKEKIFRTLLSSRYIANHNLKSRNVFESKNTSNIEKNLSRPNKILYILKNRNFGRAGLKRNLTKFQKNLFFMQTLKKLKSRSKEKNLQFFSNGKNLSLVDSSNSVFSKVFVFTQRLLKQNTNTNLPKLYIVENGKFLIHNKRNFKNRRESSNKKKKSKLTKSIQKLGFIFLSKFDLEGKLKQVYLSKLKYLQKKRRKKKLKLENRRRKKRKRFYPRPIWLRYNLYKKFLNKRYNKNFLISNKMIFTDFYKNKIPTNQLNSYTVLKNQKSVLNKFNFKRDKKQKFKSLIQRNNKQKWGNFYLDTNLIEKNCLKKFVLATKIPIYYNKNYYKISNQILNEFMPLYWKSYWLRNNLKPYMNRIRKNLSYQKFILTQQNSLEFFSKEVFWSNLLGFFNSSNLFQKFSYSEKFHVFPSVFKSVYLKINTFENTDLQRWTPLQILPRCGSGSRSTMLGSQRTQCGQSGTLKDQVFESIEMEVCETEKHSQSYKTNSKNLTETNFHKKISFEQSPLCFYSNKKISFQNLQDFYFSNMQITENIRLIKEHDRILFNRISEIIKNVKSNITLDGQSNVTCYKLPKSKYNLLTNSLKLNKTNSLLNTLKTNIFQQLNADFSFFSAFNLASLNSEKSSILKPYASNATLRVLWAFNKTNLFSFKEKNSIKNLWETYKNREQSKSNQTKKFLKKTKNMIFNKINKPFSNIEIRNLWASCFIKKKFEFDEANANNFLKNTKNCYINLPELHKLYTLNTETFKKFENSKKKLLYSSNITNRKLFYAKKNLNTRNLKYFVNLTKFNFISRNNFFIDKLNTLQKSNYRVLESKNLYNYTNRFYNKKSSIFFWWSNKNFQTPIFFNFICKYNGKSSFSSNNSMLFYNGKHELKVIEKKNSELSNPFDSQCLSLDKHFRKHRSARPLVPLCGIADTVTNRKNFNLNKFYFENSLSSFLWIFAVLFHFCMLISFLKIPELRSLLKFQFSLIYKFLNIYLITLNSFFNSVKKFQSEIKKSFSHLRFSYIKTELFNSLIISRTPVIFESDSQRKPNFMHFWNKAKRPWQQLIQSKNLNISVKKNYVVSFYTNFFKKKFSANNFNYMIDNQKAYKSFLKTKNLKFNSKAYYLDLTSTYKLKRFSIKFYFLNLNKQKQFHRNIKPNLNLVNIQKIYWFNIFKFFSKKTFFLKNFIYYSLVGVFKETEFNLTHNSNYSALKFQAKLSLWLTFLSKFFVFSGLAGIQVSYKVLLKLIETVESFFLLIYKFLEKPAELMIESIAQLFLIEWISDICSFIPETLDKNLWESFQKFSRPTRLFNSIYFQNSKNSGLDCFSSISFSFILLSTIKQTYFVLWQSLLKPDVDLYCRQKKGIYYMNLWAEIFIQAAEKYQMNVASLVTNNSEQERFMERLLKDPEIFSLNYTKNYYLANSRTNSCITINQHIISSCFGGQSTESDLFLDIAPPKSFQSISYLHSPVYFIVGPILCEVYSGLFSKKISKNILLVTKQTNSNLESLKKSKSKQILNYGTFLIQALAGETEMKLMVDNAKRYAVNFHNKAIGMRLLKDVFMSIALQTPSFFLMEDIHYIGEKRPMLIGIYGDENNNANFINLEQDEVHFQNQSIYQLSRHKILDYKRPYKGDSFLIPANFYNKNFYSNKIYKTFGLPDSTKMNSLDSNNLANKNQISNFRKKQKKHPFPLSFIERITKTTNSTSLNNTNPFLTSRLQKQSEEFFAPPSTSPFTILMMKDQKKLKLKKANFIPWTIIKSQNNQFIEKSGTESLNQTIRSKIAELADITLRNFSGSLDMITDLLVIVDSVRSNRGFVVFATTHLPSVLDPALRRPGRFDETLCLPEFYLIENQIIFNNLDLKPKFNPYYYIETQVQSTHNRNTCYSYTYSYTNKINYFNTKSCSSNFFLSINRKKQKFLQPFLKDSQIKKLKSKLKKAKIHTSALKLKKLVKNQLTKILFLSAHFIGDYIIQADFLKYQTNKYFNQTIKYNKNFNQLTIVPILFNSSFQYKNLMICFLAPKILDFFYYSTLFHKLSNTNVNFIRYSYKKSLENQRLLLPFNDSSNSKDFIFSVLQNRYFLQKNFIISKMFSKLENLSNSLKEPPGPPISEILMPAKKYEAFKSVEIDFTLKNSFSIYNKMHSHQKQRFLKKLYNQPIQFYFKSHTKFNDFSTFMNSFKELGFLNAKSSISKTSLLKGSSSNYYYKTRFLIRHRLSITNQWWNGQLPEHNMESTFLSDVDWRSMYVQSNNNKSLQKDQFLDFSDADQHYNPRIRKWVFNNIFFNRFNFENTFTYEIYYHFLMQSFHEAYSYFDKNRELLDYFIFKYLEKGSILELNSIFILSRFYKK